MNGDGFADVIVGALGYDAGESNEGAAFVFLGSVAGIGDGNPTTAAAQLECPPIVLLYDADEKLRERQTDSNGDCRADEFVYYEAGLPMRAEQDMDYDGVIDAWVRYGPDRLPVQQEIDTNGDAKVDQRDLYNDNSVLRGQEPKVGDTVPN